ncbi:hypothetical protein [Ferruginibacter sp.]
MPVKYFTAVGISFTVLIFSCGKKNVPQSSANTATVSNTSKPVIKKPVVKKAPAAPIAKVIIVNDSVAKKSFDGRLYYDVDGHRYWRNYKDGKYYLFNKSMYSDPAFKPQ